MRSFVLYLLFTVYCLLPTAFYTSAQDTSNIKIPTDTSAFYIVETKDGTILKGKLIERNGGEIKFLDNHTGSTVIKVRRVVMMEKISNDSYFVFYMKDGSFLHGRIIRYNENEVGIETKDVGTKTIPYNRIKEMRQVEEKDIHRRGKYWYPNRDACRYLFGPTAIPIEKGEGYFQNADLLVNSANYGFTKNFSLQVGAVVPLAVFIMPRYGYKVQENLHVGGGLFYGVTLLKFRNSNYKMGAAYGLATLGNNNTNVSFGLGYGFAGTSLETHYPDKPLITIGATARLSKRFALVTENMIFPLRYTEYMAAGKVHSFNYKGYTSYGFRILKERTSIDFGFLTLPQEIIAGFIFVDIVFRF